MKKAIYEWRFWLVLCTDLDVCSYLFTACETCIKSRGKVHLRLIKFHSIHAAQLELIASPIFQ